MPQHLAVILPIASGQFDPILFRLVIKSIIAIVFLGMNLLYLLFFRNGKQDYFESLPEEKKLLILQAKEEYTPIVKRPRQCHCGYDLDEAPERWEQSDIEIPARCPECSRLIFGDEREAPITAIPAAEVDEKPVALIQTEVAQEPLDDLPEPEQILAPEPAIVQNNVAGFRQAPPEEATEVVDEIGLVA